jgi:hypothetical protein
MAQNQLSHEADPAGGNIGSLPKTPALSSVRSGGDRVYWLPISDSASETCISLTGIERIFGAS